MAIDNIDSLSINDIKPITVSFKKNEEELTLYKWILEHSGYSGFIKDILKREMNEDSRENAYVKENTQSNNLIELDF